MIARRRLSPRHWLSFGVLLGTGYLSLATSTDHCEFQRKADFDGRFAGEEMEILIQSEGQTLELQFTPALRVDRVGPMLSSYQLADEDRHEAPPRCPGLFQETDLTQPGTPSNQGGAISQGFGGVPVDFSSTLDEGSCSIVLEGRGELHLRLHRPSSGDSFALHAVSIVQNLCGEPEEQGISIVRVNP